MALLHRLLAAGTAVFAVTLSTALPAVAAPDPDPAGAGRAAGFLVSQLVDGTHLASEFGDESITADGVLALVAAGRAEDTGAVDAMVGFLEQNAATYATASPESAAKLALVAHATGRDAAAFGGQDLLALVQAGIQPDGSFGAFPGPFASGLAMVALANAEAEIPQPMVDWLIAGAASGGGWGYDPSQPADADSTGMALLGLTAVPDPGDNVTDAITAATGWATSARAADGSWPGFAPANSTAILGTALQALGSEQPESVAYLAGLQQPDGGLPTGAEGATGSDLLATAQGTLLLAGASYLDPSPTPANTGLDTTSAVLWAVIVVLGLGAGAFALRRRPA